MKKLDILNTKKIKEIIQLIEKQFGCKYSFDNMAVFMSPKNKIYIINKDMNRVEYDKLNINSIGLYFGEINRGSLRLTIEGSQIIGPFAKKGIIELNEKHTKQWMAGEDIELDEDYPVEFYIIKNKLGDFLSSGKVKEKKLLNYVPKERRV